MEFPPNKVLFRDVVVKTPDRALPARTFVVGIDGQGVRVRRKGEKEESQTRLSWRTIIGLALIHLK